jgi:hypothetical protein
MFAHLGCALFALPLPRLPRDRSQAGETRRLLSLKCSQLWHFNEYRECGRFRNAWDADQDAEFPRQRLVLRDLLGDGDIELPKLCVDLLEMCIDLIF